MPGIRPMRAPTSTTRLAWLAFATLSAHATVASAQIDDSIRGAPSEANHFIETPRGWRHPRTPWGEPDIQATLDMMQASRIPLERCADSYSGRRLPTFLFGDVAGAGGGARARPCDMEKAWLTQEEHDRRLDEWRNQGDASRQAFAEGDLGRAMRTGALDPNIPQRQTSLIVDPPTGLLPELTREGKRRALAMRSGWALPGENHTYDGPQDFDSWDRCVTRGMPSSMMPYRYNGGFTIVQAPGYVVFQLEMIHEARVIPTDGRAPLPREIAQWMGESRGRWEGNTLVVETTNYAEGAPLINLAVVGSPPGNRFPYSREMKTTERIVRLNADWWLYEIATEDPVVLTRPFTVRYPMRHDAAYVMPEYACHENNTIVPNYVRTNRHERESPAPIPAEPVEAGLELAGALEGRWVGRPRIATLDLDIALEFVRESGTAVVGRLLGTSLGAIDEPLRNVRIEGRALRFDLPNWQPWVFAGELTAEGTIAGVVSSEQGGVPVTFRRVITSPPYFPDVYLAPQYEAPANAPARVVVAAEQEPGEQLIVTGRVLDGTEPVVGASIYVFHTDVDGFYARGLTGNDGELNPRLHGAMRSDADGRYEFATIRPGHYDGNASHVHYIVRASGYKPMLLDLWFEDDPELVARRTAGRPEIPLSFPPNVVAIRPVTRDADGTWRTTRDIEMVRE